MRTLIVTEFITVDGVIDSPGGGEHPHSGWTINDVPFQPEAYELKGREQEEATALMVGRRSWSQFHEIWPGMSEEFPQYNAMAKYVVSTTLTQETVTASPWQPMTVLRSIDDVRRLKAGQGGPVIVHGSATLVQSLAAADLIDRYHLLVFPVILGCGLRLFADGAPKQRLRLVESRTFDNGITAQVLEVVRDPG